MKKEEFKPYISDEHVQTEFTPTSIIIGILLLWFLVLQMPI